MPEKKKSRPRLLQRFLLLLLAAALVFVFLFSGPVNLPVPAAPEPPGIQVAPAVIRFHILAHSDDPEDQAVKNRVRDQVLELLAPSLGAAASLEDVHALLNREMERLREALVKLLELWGVDQEVTLRFQEQEFPTRAYAGQVYPAGTYQTFTVVLGEGQGENWWCVMFPPLCLTELALIPEREAPEASPAAAGENSGEGQPFEGGEGPVLRLKIWAWIRGFLSFLKK